MQLLYYKEIRARLIQMSNNKKSEKFSVKFYKDREGRDVL